jgi:DNA-binding LacI/PurR family transcriptional regulator
MTKKSTLQTERATLQEVATLAQVSVTTVSLVLAGKAGNRRISEDTHHRVRTAAEELNYAPNLLTRSLRRGRTHILSFFSTFRNREEDDQYMDRMVAAVEGAGGHAGYDVLVHCNFRRSPKEIYQFLNGGLADGLLLFAPLPNDPLLPLLRKSALPVVIVNGRDPERMYPSVADDMRAGMRLIAEQLISHGHRRIAALASHEAASRDSIERVEVLRTILAESGIVMPPSAIIPLGSGDAVTAMASLMAQDEPPTAVFCWHDRLAYRVLAACETLGISIPDQLSVVGYDGIQWPSATRHIAASVKVDLNALAKRAVDILDHQVLGFPSTLIEATQPVFFTGGTSLGHANSMQRSNLQ